MTKRRREKIDKIISCSVYRYIERGNFEYLIKQPGLFRKHAKYLYKMNSRAFKRATKQLLENIRSQNDY